MSIPNTQRATYSVTVKGESSSGGLGAKKVWNVFTYRRLSTAPVITKIGLYNIFNATVITALIAAMNVRYSVQAVGIRNMDDPDDFEMDFANAGVGAIASDSLPVRATVNMVLITGMRNQNFRGRKFFSPASEADTTQDILTGVGLVRWQAVQAAVLAQLIDANVNTWTPCVVSRAKSVLTHRPQAVVTSSDVERVKLALRIGNLSRRKSPTSFV